MYTHISNELKQFIVQQSKAHQDITASTELQDDLSIYGDDATEFLIEYSVFFKVDVSKFMAADYFDSEGFDLFGLFKKRRSRKKLTVLHLQRGIDAGKLDEATIENV